MSNFLNKMNDINKNSEPDKIVKIVEDILRFNKQKQGQGIKILTRNQVECLVDYQFLWHNLKQEIIQRNLKMK